ncbi:hypothetical protein SIN8267_00691 [Sinobacterium norvegicum]|uniref:Uncharacterized protein n=1 Tax=Sinobacterium norvegicum TaxID=1641715 RepID=A0ABN8EGX7_9GAMM|nr:hypothetical protein SIN8267_00691 [Sinobacterium norvegicum]
MSDKGSSCTLDLLAERQRMENTILQLIIIRNN